MTRLPPLSPELEAIFAPLRTPSPLSPVVVSRVMARAIAARERTSPRRRHARLGFWAFAAIGGALLTVGAGAYVARAWMHAPAAPPAASAVAPRLWPSSRPPRTAASVSTPVAPPEPAPHTRVAVARARATNAATTNAELQLLRTARQDITRGDYASALTVIGQHRRRFENGTLVEEREALRVKSLAGLGRGKEARAAAAAFRARFPHSVFLSTFERLRESDR